jgi:hypothetical protein
MPDTRYESPSCNSPVFPGKQVGIRSLVGHPYLLDTRFSDVIICRALITHAGLSPRMPNSTGSGVCGTQTTTSFAVSTVSHVCGNVANSAANRLPGQLNGVSPNRSGWR